MMISAYADEIIWNAVPLGIWHSTFCVSMPIACEVYTEMQETRMVDTEEIEEFILHFAKVIHQLVMQRTFLCASMSYRDKDAAWGGRRRRG